MHEASNGRDGFRIICEKEPDIVLSDVDMPIQNGFDLMRQIRGGNKKFAGMSFIFISGRAKTHEQTLGLAAGADDYIVKPIDYDHLDSKIGALARHKDRLFDSWSVSNIGVQLRESLAVSSLFLGGLAILGVVVLLFLYYLKSALGIDIFKDAHLSDIIGI